MMTDETRWPAALDRIKELEGEREEAVKRVLAAGMSTGHANTLQELFDEVLDQAIDYRGRVAFLEAFADPPDMETGKTSRDELAAEVEELKAAMLGLVDRIEKGQVRSTRTYKKFRDLLRQGLTPPPAIPEK